MVEEEIHFQQAMSRGHAAAWDQDWEGAVRFFRQALKRSPKDPQALTNLGLALVELEEDQEALQYYQEAARITPGDPLPFEKIGQIYERKKNRELAVRAYLDAGERYLKNREVQKAIENWQRVDRLDPDNLQSHLRLALVYEKLGQKEKAVVEYLDCARFLQKVGHLEKARQAIEQALKLIPEGEEARHFLSLLRDFKPLPKPTRNCCISSPLEESKDQYKELLEDRGAEGRSEMDPVECAAHKALTALAGMLFEFDDLDNELFDQKGRRTFAVGEAKLLNSQRSRIKAVTHLSRAVNFQAQGEYAPAAVELQRAINAGLETPVASFDLGYLLVRADRLDNAIPYLQNTVNSQDHALAARLLLGEIQLSKGRPDKALLDYMEALKLADLSLAPPDQTAQLLQRYNLLIQSHRQQDEPEKQLQLCERIRQLLIRADWENLIKHARKGLQYPSVCCSELPLVEVLMEGSDGRLIDAVSAIGEMIEHSQLNSAMEEAYFALQHAPTFLPVHAMMGDMLAQQGDLEGAAIKFQALARLCEVQNEIAAAIQYMRKVIELTPTDLSARSRLIELLIASGGAVEAIEEYIQLAEVHQSMADGAAARKVYLDALKMAREVNADRLTIIKLLHCVADIDVQNLDWRKAIRIYEQIRTMQPDDEEARLQMIQLNLRLGLEQTAFAELDNYLSFLAERDHKKRLVSFLGRLVDENPEQIPIRRRYAEALRSDGQTEKAVVQLDAVGEMLLQAGDRAGAIQVIEALISLSPPHQSEYLNLLNQLRGEKTN